MAAVGSTSKVGEMLRYPTFITLSEQTYSLSRFTLPICRYKGVAANSLQRLCGCIGVQQHGARCLRSHNPTVQAPDWSEKHSAVPRGKTQRRKFFRLRSVRGLLNVPWQGAKGRRCFTSRHVVPDLAGPIQAHPESPAACHFV